MKKADPNPKANRNILKLVYVIVALFLGLIAYMAYFLQVRGEDVINNSYNARLDSFADPDYPRQNSGLRRHCAGGDTD